ncbi:MULTISPECIES: dual specificity protein phosphatase family protein [unclassified Ensifer]|uniref:tyrosine phosphatase family protein n=1 Tax=unclassified Ensifer TaxID=2633371 RepID=UPI00081346E3|nr:MULTISPECIES: dual specificity protein phosphatase family protein [unclassified Ensifer]OCO98394.1 protein-tyrosine-phosphatase [Ensifer sp. LC14]OCP02491.1 protein-tyrosine-phosphatase [Ensifer sp. LC11]OCP02614.1 protein-tyrosine-phosphatase [Ensifer sp. LC13]OCP29837.1 protein-tyrosine-phosphatase [Ensifer sp. LC499]
METTFSPVLTVCGIDELPGQSSRKVTHVLSIVDPELPELEAFGSYGAHHRTTLRFHDIIAAAPNQVMPRPDHVEAILRFGTDFLAREDKQASSHVLVHCHMGVSRSTAAMLTLMAQANPDEPGESLFARLAAIRPQAWPNSQMIGFADEQLGRGSDLTTALRRHYGRQIRNRPEFTEWMTTLGRQAELKMAVLD